MVFCVYFHLQISVLQVFIYVLITRKLHDAKHNYVNVALYQCERGSSCFKIFKIEELIIFNFTIITNQVNI